MGHLVGDAMDASEFSAQRIFVGQGRIIVVENNTAYLGAILSAVMLLRIVIDYFVGKEIDFQSKRRWYYIGAIIIAVAVLGLTFFGFSLPFIALFSSLLMLGYSLFQPYESVLTYNSIKESKLYEEREREKKKKER